MTIINIAKGKNNKIRMAKNLFEYCGLNPGGAEMRTGRAHTGKTIGTRVVFLKVLSNTNAGGMSTRWRSNKSDVAINMEIMASLLRQLDPYNLICLLIRREMIQIAFHGPSILSFRYISKINN